MEIYLIVTEETTVAQYLEEIGCSDEEIEQGIRDWENRKITWVRIMTVEDKQGAVLEAVRHAEGSGRVLSAECVSNADDARSTKRRRIHAVCKRKNTAYVSEKGRILISTPMQSGKRRR